MSDTKTPETDWVIKNCNGWHHVPAEKARELEIERNALIDERDKLKADAAAMREALTKERAAIARFLVPWRSHLDQSWLDNFVESGSVRFNEIGYVFPVEVSTNTGSELLAELKRLRAQHEFSDGQAAYYARLCDTKDAELNSLRDELKSAREEVERAKADRNKSGVEERKKYLPKIQELTADLAKAQSHLAELKSEVETWNECYRFISDFYAQNPPDRWLNSRARKAVTGKLT